jgi:glycogen debranching enzyme
MLLLSITFENDFADVFEARGTQRARRGAVRSLVEGNGAEFIYLGLDGKRRRTRIVFEPTPTHLSPSLASFQLDLEPHKSVSLFGTISCDLDRPEPPPFLKSLRSAHRELKRMTKVGTEIETSNQVFNEVLRRATADLAILLTHTPQETRPVPLSMELRPAATVLDDQALIAAIPGSNLADSIALAAEAGGGWQ